MQPDNFAPGEPQPATDAEIKEFTAFAEILADAAGAAILPYFRAETAVAVENKAKGGFDPVTAADRTAEQAMRDLIAKKFPKHGIIGEEFPEKKSRNGYSWVLDPIDGTRAFISGLPTWGVLIGLVQDGRPLIGVIDQPYIGERFIGFPGGALFKRGAEERPMSVRPCGKLQEAVLSTTDQHLFVEKEAQAFDQVRAAVKLTRYGFDCYAYAILASGHIDLVIESGLKQHDVAALIPVIEGAGGVVSNWRGGPAFMGGQVIAAGDDRIHAQALVALKRAAS